MMTNVTADATATLFRTPMFLVISILFSFVLSFSAKAQDKAIIVFDASGSMWGQLDGKTKIEIAKKTLANVVTNWDEKKQLGLVVYGHRRKGDCKDIETLVPVGQINKASMIAKVNKINPKGKTPISAAIRMAANELKFTEDKATVILISDGKETCNANPCDTAAELEKLGVNFTAHVIGFGVDKQTSEQLQCIAANTGGLYFPADNAEQLSVALKQIVVKAKVISIRAMDEKNGGIFHKMIDWKLINQDTEEVISIKGSGAGVEILLVNNETDENSKNLVPTGKSITPGKWLVSGTSGSYAGEATVNIENEDQLIKVDLKKHLPKVTLIAADEAITGTELDVSWKIPKGLKGLVNLQMADEKPRYNANPLKFTKDIAETTMRLPSVAGNYLLRFYDNEDRQILAEKAITLKAAEISINAPEEAGTGTEIDISWVAPKQAEAKINLEMIGDKPKFHSNPHLYTKNKKEGVMRMPSEPGDYVLRWYNLSDRKIIVEKPIKLVESVITLNAPNEAGAGTEIDISWEAPKTAEAKINLEPVGEKPKYHSNPYLYTRNKKEGVMRMPSQEGEYILRWYNISDQAIVIERPIKVTAQTITLNAPETATAGSEIEISWDAPKGLDSFININPSDEKPNYNAKPYIYTKKNSSAYMRLPSEPGDYTLRWFNRSDKTPLAKTNIKLTKPEITLTADDEAIAGTETEISWSAPKGLDSFINIQLADEKPNYNAKNYIYTKKNSSAYLRLPSEAGEYMLRWYNRNHQKPIAERPIKLNAPDITINVPDDIKADSEIEISWKAPRGLDDSFINIQPAGEKPNYNAKRYIYTRKKRSEYMKMPAEPGEYVLRWFNKSVTKPVTEKKITINPGE